MSDQRALVNKLGGWWLGAGKIFKLFARSDAAATIYFIAQFCAASIRERLLIESGKLRVLGKIFRNRKGNEKNQFYKINEELRCGDLLLKQTFQLDQPPLCYKAVPTRHLQCVSSLPMISHDDRPPCLKK